MFNNHSSFRIIITCSFLDRGQHCWSMFVNKNFSRRQNLRRRWRMYKAHPRCTFRGPRARASLGKFWNLVLLECIIYCILEHELGTIWTQHFTIIMKFWLFFYSGRVHECSNFFKIWLMARHTCTCTSMGFEKPSLRLLCILYRWVQFYLSWLIRHECHLVKVQNVVSKSDSLHQVLDCWTAVSKICVLNLWRGQGNQNCCQN